MPTTQDLKVRSFFVDVSSMRGGATLLSRWLALRPESPKQDEGKSKQPQGDRYDPEQGVESLESWRQQDRGSVSGAHQVQYLFIRLALVNRIR